MSPELTLRAGDRTLRFDGRPRLMAIVNASPDSFSGTDADPVATALAALEAGADVIDVGGESARTDRPALTAEEEIARVAPVVEHVAGEAAIAAGAAMVNDVSGLRDPALAEVCAATGAALVVTHTVGEPKRKVLDHAYRDVAAEVAAFLAEKLELARAHGVAAEQVLVDPGPDLGKTPAQTVAALRGLPAVVALGRPVLLAVSRKDFVGALTGRPPRERLAGTLAAIGYGVDAGAHLLRVHDVRAVADYLRVRASLRGDDVVPADLRLPEELRRES